jgi:hypothetical protein
MVKSSQQEVVGTEANSLDRVRVSMAKLRQGQSKVSLPVNGRQSDSVAWGKTKTERQNEDCRSQIHYGGATVVQYCRSVRHYRGATGLPGSKNDSETKEPA